MKFYEDKLKYPRPGFYRKSYTNLNGRYELAFLSIEEGINKKYPEGFDQQESIEVPYVYQVELPHIKQQNHLWYQRLFDVADPSKRHLLHFEGIDYLSRIYVNGKLVKTNEGAYHRFSVELFDLKEKDNLLVIYAYDDNRTDLPRGKQTWKNTPFACWYTESSGIYKDVWLETLNENYIKDVKITTSLDDFSANFNYSVDKINQTELEIEVSYDGESVSKARYTLNSLTDSFQLPIKTKSHQFKVYTWHPNHPDLYDVIYRLYEKNVLVDEVSSHFGFRKLETKNQGIYLNDEPIYLKMTLDQGYFKKHLTPTIQELIKDVQLTKQMGFNGIRKHQKIEDERFYFLCDVHGLYVFLEMPSAYEFNQNLMNRFSREWVKILDQYYNYTSIICHVLFNESWGIPHVSSHLSEQAFSVAMYHLTKAKDPTRLVISNDGWEHTKSDLITIHNYYETGKQLSDLYGSLEDRLNDRYSNQLNVRKLFSNGFSYDGQPVLISEYGGISFRNDDGWGYGNQVDSKEAFKERLQGLTDAIYDLKNVSGYCLTQTTDVYQETNGVLTFDRKPKLDLDVYKKINRE